MRGWPQAGGEEGEGVQSGRGRSYGWGSELTACAGGLREGWKQRRVLFGLYECLMTLTAVT